MSTTYDVAAGIARTVDLALAAPPRLGPVRLVAVDGPSGSGKTSLATPLAAAFAAAIGGRVIVPERVAMPDRVVDVGSPVRQGHVAGGPGGLRVAVVSTDLLATWEHPLDWWPVLQEHLLAPLAAGLTATMPVVTWVSGNPRPGGHIVVPPVDVLVLEGVSSGRRAVTDRLSALVWIDVPGAAVRLERAVARDGEDMRPFLARWQVDEDAHFSADGTRQRASVVIRG